MSFEPRSPTTNMKVRFPRTDFGVWLVRGAYLCGVAGPLAWLVGGRCSQDQWRGWGEIAGINARPFQKREDSRLILTCPRLVDQCLCESGVVVVPI